jgi:hypothetical protein
LNQKNLFERVFLISKISQSGRACACKKKEHSGFACEQPGIE